MSTADSALKRIRDEVAESSAKSDAKHTATIAEVESRLSQEVRELSSREMEHHKTVVRSVEEFGQVLRDLRAELPRQTRDECREHWEALSVETQEARDAADAAEATSSLFESVASERGVPSPTNQQFFPWKEDELISKLIAKDRALLSVRNVGSARSSARRGAIDGSTRQSLRSPRA
jgi:hypothetical protein